MTPPTGPYRWRFLRLYDNLRQARNLVTARYSRSKAKGAKPLVIVLPVWGISTSIPPTPSPLV